MGTSPGRIAKQCREGAMKILGKERCDLKGFAVGGGIMINQMVKTGKNIPDRTGER